MMKSLSLLFTFLLLPILPPALGQGDAPPVYIGKTKELFLVDDILIHGAKKVEPEAILEKIKTRKGMMADNYLIRQDIKNIYEMKHFESVEVHREDSKTKAKAKAKGKGKSRSQSQRKGSILIFKVKEKPIINEISIEGNREIDEEDIREQLKTKEYSILDINTLKNDVIDLEKFYEEKGFFLAAVDFQIKKTSKETAQITFNIQEFDKVLVKKITFLGNQKFSDNELKAFMSTSEKSLFSPISGSGNFKEFNFKTDIERIKYFYKTKGHLQVNVATPNITVSEDKKWIFITLKIVEGPVYTINSISFNGELLFTQEKLSNTMTIKPNSLYGEDKLRTDIQNLSELYQDQGYAFANVLRDIHIIPGETKVDLSLSFEKGHVAHFGKITIKGNTKTRDKVIRRELKIYEGMKYSGSKLRKSKENVNRLGFFEPESVLFNTSPNEKNSDTLDVQIQIKERNTGQLSMGAGYSSSTGPFLQGSIAQNNFRGLGQTLRLTVQYSENVRTFQISFTELYLADTQWSGGIDLFYDKNNLGSDQQIMTKGFSLRTGHPITEFSRGFITYKYIDTQVSNVADPTIDDFVENGPASIVEGSFVRDTRNNRFEPSEGTFLNISTEQAGFGFEKRWRKIEWDSRFYHRVFHDLVSAIDSTLAASLK